MPVRRRPGGPPADGHSQSCLLVGEEEAGAEDAYTEDCAEEGEEVALSGGGAVAGGRRRRARAERGVLPRVRQAPISSSYQDVLEYGTAGGGSYFQLLLSRRTCSR